MILSVAMTNQMINGQYKLGKQLGKGGFGTTFLAENTHRFNEFCVVKQLNFDQNHESFDFVRTKFEQEAKTLKELGEAINQIPELRGQIPQLHAYFTEASKFYLVQELVQGQPLNEKLKVALLNEAEVKQLLIDLLPVLAFIHNRNIIHRDIKPGNLIIRESDSKPVLIDFGAVKALTQTQVHNGSSDESSGVMGTEGFMPVEQQFGGSVSPCTDLYSLGITAIYALTGKRSQNWMSYQTSESRWHRFAPHVSQELKAVLDKAIQYYAHDRYCSAQEMLAAIQGLPDPEPIPDTRIEPAFKSRQPSTKLSPLALSGIGVMLAIATAVIAHLYSDYRVAEADREYQVAQADLKKIEDLKKQGDHQACVAEAKRFVQSHTMAYLNPTDRAEELGTECALASVRPIETAKAKGDSQSCVVAYARFMQTDAVAYKEAAEKAKQLSIECSTASDLENYLRAEVPEQMRQKGRFDKADTLGKLKPTVRINGDQVTIQYDGSTNSQYVTDPNMLKGIAAFFITALRGQATDFPTTKYDNFSQLTVYPTQGKLKAVITAEQWNTYITAANKAGSAAEVNSLDQQFMDQIQISTR